VELDVLVQTIKDVKLEREKNGGQEPVNKGQEVKNEQQKTLRNLEKYTRNLTKEAREDKIDPVIGREKEILRLMQILSRRTKNNPIIIGEAGTGKTAVAEGLALRMAKKRCP
jgi:ATP-dependent Clp protease ATP-binding subunit ClpA